MLEELVTTPLTMEPTYARISGSFWICKGKEKLHMKKNLNAEHQIRGHRCHERLWESAKLAPNMNSNPTFINIYQLMFTKQIGPAVLRSKSTQFPWVSTTWISETFLPPLCCHPPSGRSCWKAASARRSIRSRRSWCKKHHWLRFPVIHSSPSSYPRLPRKPLRWLQNHHRCQAG